MFVYLTICKVNGKKYIGKYEGKETDNYLGSGKLLKRALNKYGPEQFERIILERYSDTEECRNGEIKWIKRFNAVESKQYYNIAAGGEGGNTFAGIQGEERIKLIAKLKKRKRPKKKPGTILCLDVETQIRRRVPLSEFYSNNLLLGNSCKGLYLTPDGIFSSAQVAATYKGNTDYGTINKRCKNPDITIRQAHIGNDPTLQQDDLGKTFRDIGYNFIPIEKIKVNFLNKHKVIKKKKS